MEDVEILSENGIELAQEVIFEVREIETPTMIVNGVVQDFMKIPQVFVKCPCCNKDILALGQGVELVDIYKYLGEQGTPANMIPTHCVNCGTKLSCDKRIVDEVKL